METPRTDKEANRILRDVERMRIDGWNDAYQEMRLHAKKLERQLIEAQNCLVCGGIADPIEVIENTLKILSDND